MSGRGEKNDVIDIYMYKKCMEEIVNENPNLPVGAQQQMALKRCSEMNEEHEEEVRSGKRFLETGDILRGMMSKLRIGGNGRNCISSAAVVAKGEKLVALEDGTPPLGSTFGSSEHNESDCYNAENKRRHAVIRQMSVASTASDRHMLAPSINLRDRSLKDSLENIEKLSYSMEKPPDGQASHRPSAIERRKSRWASVSSELSDVEEDEESISSDTLAEEEAHFRKPSSWVGKSNPSVQKTNPLEDSVSNLLPDEIKLYLDNWSKANKEERGREPTATGDSSQHDSEDFEESHCSSMMLSTMSIDSANFHGDFSAWSSFRGR
eukprot:CAMPEP_0196133142 /NCGR_PEP_ID=MMETSP0910-20130528/2487_1 /TAXON_ID=49265 /ORGANISM="Thalassiosira rotula, Strain GSO102" /LENGTH=321 /DNA_ID=CAMNT_0041392837 /DNA_START=126 /DNA_END=1091 /DNA_ORIENTATION=-